MSARVKKLTSVLQELEQNCEITNSAIVTEKGQMVAHNLHDDVDEKSVSAMGAAILSIGNRVGTVLAAGNPKAIIINGSESIVLLRHIGKMVLISLAPKDAKVGLIDFELEKASEQIADLL
ncbi:MAG: hypothetical protein BAJATHORv1_30484 [Candidatus Thorarchaeota archaeon]|nr:MAG: hypothetical protein BAJATHORv1_30484 [Candidatus Thorarchaeota archaeon]